VGDSTLIEVIRDISIIIAGGALVLWLLVMATIAVLVYKKINAALSAVRHSAQNLAEGGQAIKESFVGKNPLFGIAAAGLGKAVGGLFRSTFRR
jgi:hypothetical protein